VKSYLGEWQLYQQY